MVDQKTLNKSLFKAEIKLLKIMPFLIALFYMTGTILSYFNIDTVLFNLIAGQSLISVLFMLVSSFVFNFCIYHRIPLYYIIVNDCLCYYDWYIGISLNNKELLILHSILIGITIFLTTYFYKIKR